MRPPALWGRAFCWRQTRPGRRRAFTCQYSRADSEIFSGVTSTAQIKRGIPELVDYLGRSNTYPNGVMLLTGAGIVPPADFTLQPGDVIRIAIDVIGILQNRVKEV